MSKSWVNLNSGSGVPVKGWVDGVPVEKEAILQLSQVAQLPFIYRWIAAMPDVHVGKGTTVGSVIPTTKAIIPTAVGVDIGCGMVAAETSLTSSQLPDDLKGLRKAIEKAIPHGRTKRRDVGVWHELPEPVKEAWSELLPGYKKLKDQHPLLGQGNDANHLGTLGTGNHFVELCIDEREKVWLMLHSGSRGVGNRIGSYFIELAKKDMEDQLGNLPDKNLAYLSEGTKYFTDYVEAVGWAQNFAYRNRALMLQAFIQTLRNFKKMPSFEVVGHAINCHHNYVEKENHYGKDIYVTRKGAVRARFGELGIIPGSMGTRSYIVKGKGNQESFESCSHGAGRKMSRTKARELFNVEDHKQATQGIECRKDIEVVDETPAAYKDIEKVIEAQSDLIEVVHTLRQVIVVKG